MPALQYGSSKGTNPAEKPGRTAKNGHVDDPLENEARGGEDRLDDDSVVELVDPVLVEKQLVRAGKGRGELCCRCGLGD